MSVDDFRVAQQHMLESVGVEADSRFIEVPVVEGRAHVLSAGRGPWVVMLTGIGTPAAMWAPLMAELGGFHLLAIDLPGYGLTDTDPALFTASSYRSTALDFLQQTLDALGIDRASFVANSLGSLWTTWLALDRPDRVSAVAHVGCPALWLGTAAPLPMRLLSVPLLSGLLMKLQPPSLKQVRGLAKMVREDPLSPELERLLLATERLFGFEETFLTTLRTLLRLRGPRPPMVTTDEMLRRIRQPTLLVWGKNDPMGSPSIGERAAEALPHAELHVVDAGHAPWLRQAALIGPLTTRFLSEHAA